MRRLKNPKHEDLAVRIARGEGAERAYVAAGYTPTSAKLGAPALLENSEVRRRIAELLDSEKSSDTDSGPGESRLEELLQQREELLRIKRARARDPLMQQVPGGDTGWLFAKLRRIRRGKQASLLVEPVFDERLARQLRTLDELIAQERTKGVNHRPTSIAARLSALSDEEIESSLAVFHRLKEAA